MAMVVSSSWPNHSPIFQYTHTHTQHTIQGGPGPPPTMATNVATDTAATALIQLCITQQELLLDDKKEGECRIVLHIVYRLTNQEEPMFKKICKANLNFWGHPTQQKQKKWQHMRTLLMLDSSINNLINKIRIHCRDQVGSFKYCLAQCKSSRLPNDQGSCQNCKHPRKATPASTSEAMPSSAPKQHKATTTQQPIQTATTAPRV